MSLNPGSKSSVTREEEGYVLSLSNSTFFPDEPPHKQLDLGKVMEAALDSGRSSKKQLTQSLFPVTWDKVDSRITEFLWSKDRESRCPYRMRELDPKLLTAANLARNNLASRMSCLTQGRPNVRTSRPRS